MTFLYVLMIVSVALGGALLWLSGWMAGLRRSGPRDDRAETPSPLITESLRRERDALALDLSGTAAALEAAKASMASVEEEKARVEEELSRAVAEMGRVEGEMAEVESELTRLSEENESLRASAKERPRPPVPSVPSIPPMPPPLPRSMTAPVEASEELDDAEAMLDMEKVAHKKTRDELEALKKLVKSVGSVGPSGMGMAGPRRGDSGFKTMSIDTRASQVTGTEHDRLRQSHDKLAREKERLETELARAQQELQLLKMRQG